MINEQGFHRLHRYPLIPSSDCCAAHRQPDGIFHPASFPCQPAELCLCPQLGGSAHILEHELCGRSDSPKSSKFILDKVAWNVSVLSSVSSYLDAWGICL